ncbi:ankyrin repeat-containing domain protein [Phaeosphaeriaceae sp. PMI808]|nr:ankyrin repeat-containing domain protein [Phaeosphaeriaceae sp. PMI808]
MFLWVNLQLDSICEISKAQKDRLVENALETLPQGLPDTYIRILERIEGQSPYMRELAFNCLAWIIYARRPLSIEEMQIALATRSSYSSGQELELDPPKVILEACGNLLEEVDGAIRPIHYTVQEFLGEPDRRVRGDSIRRQVSYPNTMHTRLSLVCLEYLHLVAFTRPTRDPLDLYVRLQNNPFAGYASQNFDYHFSKCDNISPDTIELLEKLLQQESQGLAAVLQIKVLRAGLDYGSIQRHFDPIQFPISASTIVYSTDLYNMPEVRQRWVEDTPPVYALHLASSAGLVTAVDRLLDAGCDINEKDRSGSSPLYSACFEGHLRIIQTLLNRGADINAQGGYYGNALQAASYRGHEQVVKLLLNKGAEVNAQGGEYGNSNALQAASEGGHEQVVKLLLDKGAEVNAQGGYYGNALQAASEGGHEQVVKLLLDKGAEVNAQGRVYNNALYAASYRGYKQMVKLLLDKGAEVNAQGGYYGNALQAASEGGHEQVVKLLLDKGAEVNARGGYYGNALQAASEGGHEQVVKLLLNKGAEVNAQGGVYGNALQAASEGGHGQVVKLLLNQGAEVNAHGGVYGNALYAASEGGHGQVVKLLLNKGATPLHVDKHY